MNSNFIEYIKFTGYIVGCGWVTITDVTINGMKREPHCDRGTLEEQTEERFRVLDFIFVSDFIAKNTRKCENTVIDKSMLKV